MNWNLTRGQYLADFYVVPTWSAVALFLGVAHGHASAWWLLNLAVGALLWTLAEYVLHRWIFHGVYRRDHALHHARPDAWIGVTPLVSLLTLGAVWLLMVAATGDFGQGGAMFLGFAMGYYAYISIHLMVHHSDRLLAVRLRAHHASHHHAARTNFGVSTSLWDHVFRSYKPVVSAAKRAR